ncbi:hypothetical protein CONLIGDRAFT_686805 [Coniochaeta ligniaria NRRL 30616]|uniref:Uncharacterized protein n=1 Tax=Coniochaeta ligniaria NRRL 30616 TaxID=1408157 RepID=A0A1J7IQI7_9PEZI|nr:hypothetical protein CONLIGDRAFT_686805 [Coniochaeta ligniaria NRRL 30616]
MSSHTTTSPLSSTSSSTPSVKHYYTLVESDLLADPSYRNWVSAFLSRHPELDLQPQPGDTSPRPLHRSATGLSAVSTLPSAHGQLSPTALQNTVSREWPNYLVYLARQQEQEQQQQQQTSPQQPPTTPTAPHRLDASVAHLTEAITAKDSCFRAAIEYDTRLKRMQTELLVALDEGDRGRVQSMRGEVLDVIRGYQGAMARAAGWSREVEERMRDLVREGFRG